MTTDERRFINGIGLGLLLSGLMAYVGYRPASAFVPTLVAVLPITIAIILRRRQRPPS